VLLELPERAVRLPEPGREPERPARQQEPEQLQPRQEPAQTPELLRQVLVLPEPERAPLSP
jgi:hypothetical protein